MEMGTYAQWAAVVVAVFAVGIAIKSILSQRAIAKKRAAIDFFLKTEMDDKVLAAYNSFVTGVEDLKVQRAAGKTFEQFAGTTSYQNIRAYLNLHELMAVGVKEGVFDNDVCYEFWSGELDRAYESTRDLIEYIQSRADEPGTYCELVALAKKWAKRWKV